MNEIRFSCPSCGQHIQCEPDHAGVNVPCPGCATLIRVPPMTEFDEESDIVAMSLKIGPEKVSYAPMQPAGDTQEKSPEQSTSNRDASEHPVSPSPESGPDQKLTPTGATVHSLDLQCACPVCQSRLQISIRAESASEHVSALALKSQSEHLSPAEREEQIEAAHKAHQVLPSMYPQFKPRLDKILDGSGADH